MVRCLALCRSLVSSRLAVFAIVIFTYCCTEYYESSKNEFLLAEYQTQIEILQRNNLMLEKWLEVRNRELYMLKNQIHITDNSSRVSRPDELRLPSFFDFLPHLYAAPPDALRPALTFHNKSGNSPVEIVIGIPTISRQNFSYIIPTLQSLIAGLSVNHKNKATIVVLIADEDGPETNFVASHLQSLHTEFSYELENGLLQIIAPSKDWYPPDLHSITPTFGDQPDRMYWRTKQNLDYIFLMLYCQQKGEYYLQLEDDVMAKSGYLEQIMNFLKSKEMEDWLMLEFSSLGFIGKLFRSSDLTLITQFIALFYRQKPVDWILDLLFINRYCHPEKSNKQCTEMAKQHRIRHRPSLFQHIGVHSSLAGKLQKLRERDFGKAQVFIAHPDNPPAKESTSLKQYA